MRSLLLCTTLLIFCATPAGTGAPPEQTAALGKPEGERSTSDWELVYKSKEALLVSDQDVVDRIVEAQEACPVEVIQLETSEDA